MRLSLCLAVLGGLAGCQRSPDEAKASATQAAGSAKAAVVAGTERGDCRPDHTCDTGLLCLSDLCVRPPAADCAAVAEIIASFELGNYAPRDKRDAMLGQKKAMCEAQRLSKDDQKCIVDAKDKWAIVKCAPAMYPELASTNQGSGATDCEAVVATLTRIIQTQMSATGGGQDPMTQKMIGLATQAVRSSCLEDGWPDALRACMVKMDPQAGADMKQCENLMPPGLEAKMQQRMSAMMGNVMPPQQVAPPPPPSGPTR